MKKAELVFIPSPGLSHLTSTVEMAKLLLHRDDRLIVTVLIMKLPNDATVAAYTHQLTTTSAAKNLRLLHLPTLDDAPPHRAGIPHDFIEKQTPNIKETISNLIQRGETSDSRLAALVLDIFCASFVEIGRAFALPSYVYCTSSVACLGLSRLLVEMRFEKNQTLTRYRGSEIELSVPSYKSKVPANVLPAEMTAGDQAADDFLRCFKRLKEAKGIIANTFYEFESFAIDALNRPDRGENPRIFPVGPILNESEELRENDEVKKWLDEQERDSVIFLCFGSMGRLSEAQAREISLALEKAGCRFLWSLRNVEEIALPEGFLERTKGAGKVIGWAAQAAVLAHAAVGGFVSHCGWNSTLESVWFGVPIATFPLYAEQQMNAFYLVKEMGMAEMIRLDYKMGFGGAPPPEIVGAEEIAAAIGRLMAAEGVREKVKEMQRKAREAVVEGGSSFNAVNLFIEDVVGNIDLE